MGILGPWCEPDGRDWFTSELGIIVVNEPGKKELVLGANGDISDYWWAGAVGQPCLRASHIWLLPGPPAR